MRTAIGLILFVALLCTLAWAQTDVADITAALAQSDGTNVRITGKVKVLGYGKLAYAPQSNFAIVDSSGVDGQTGLWIYHGDRVSGISDGDTISNIVGSLSTYQNLRELTPGSAHTPTQHTGGDALPALVPLQLTGTEYTTNYANYESEYIKLIGTFDSPGGTFAVYNGYDFTTQDSTSISVYIQTSSGSELVGETIPSGVQEVSGVAQIYATTYEILPMYSSDLQDYVPPTATPTPPVGPSAADGWTLYE